MKLVRSESGTALIEIALILPMLLALFVGIADYTTEIQQAMVVQEAASAGAAYGAIPGNQENKAGMQNAAISAANGLSGFSVAATYFYTCTPGGAAVVSTAICSGYGTPMMYVQVVTSATVTPMVPLVHIGSLNTGIAGSQLLGATATYKVPWTL